MKYGYARVSPGGKSESVDAQARQLTKAGCRKVFRDVHVSGAKTDRAQLRRVIETLEPGDVLMVTRLDRLARSTRDLLNTPSDRATKAGHLTATDQSHCSRYILARRGPSTYGSPRPTPTSSQRNTSGQAGWKRLGPVVTMRSRAAGFRMPVMSRIRHATIVP